MSNRQSVVPMIAYVDAASAIDWLTQAFGFRERERITAHDGTISHAELEANAVGGIVMLATPSPDYEGSRLHREQCERARAWLSVPWVVDGVLVYVDDVDTHSPVLKPPVPRSCPNPKTAHPLAATVLKTLKGTAGCSCNGSESNARGLGRLPA
jgi:hypothetical protein